MNRLKILFSVMFLGLFLMGDSYADGGDGGRCAEDLKMENQEASSSEDEYYLDTVFSNEALRSRFKDYLAFRHIDKEKFYQAVDAIRKKSKAEGKRFPDQQFYRKLQLELKRKNLIFSRSHGMDFHGEEKEFVANQVSQLMEETTSNGYVEIGTPASYIGILKKRSIIQRPTYAIDDIVEPFSRLHYIAWFFGFIEYDEFIDTNVFLSKEIKIIRDNRIELVTLFFGFSNKTEGEVKNLIASIHRILKPGGSFILREYDVKDDDLKNIVHAAHMINAILYGRTPENYEAMYFNFQPLDFWIRLLQENGFILTGERLLQKGDPTMNTMIRFKKK